MVLPLKTKPTVAGQGLLTEVSFHLLITSLNGVPFAEAVNYSLVS